VEGQELPEYDVNESPFGIALGWHLLLSTLLVILGGNHEILTRVVSISPLYILNMLDLLMTKERTFLEKLLAQAVAGMNLIQLVFNMIAFPLHMGFL
jgi:hypothetical protein